MSYPPSYPPPPGYPMPPRDHPQATTALVLGILGIVVCGILAPFAWSIGNKAVNEIDRSGGQLGGRGSANAGRILGIVGTVLLCVAVVGAILVLAVGASTSSFH
jgi:uncharacterized membrane protein YjgN (DUF898 family)